MQQAAILIGGLLVAGPVVTLVLPRVSLPRVAPPARSLRRWIAAMGISLAVRWLILTLFKDPTRDQFVTLTVVALAVAAPLFRVLLEAGAGVHAARTTRGVRTRDRHPPSLRRPSCCSRSFCGWPFRRWHGPTTASWKRMPWSVTRTNS